ncbi:restriction endonuclease subunit S [Alcaligenes aquatilis]|jgi:type I restriction enzyme S subunit|uniref:restriction endonuclease subunit S n=1 Tax=Alcaligenes aquatilis TaxID=323284 RepID=UPI002AA6EE11|nr:restriction endonuclease subunit S [Alcaligenes faecalis]MCH4224077.1 restriction endonuclease subunit S [Alcaligenes faecalis]
MSSEWTTSTLGEFLRLQRGHDLTSSDQKPGNVPVMGSAGPNGTHNEALACGPGVVIGRSGASIGRVHFSEASYWPHNTCLYVTDFLGNNPKFAYYLLQTLNLAAYNSGSAQPSLNRNLIYTVPLQIPSRSEQDVIAKTLSALDDRITLLRETNQTLESIAQAIFKSWFVDFDPVRAKMEGRQPEGIDEETAALFPDSFEESELGLIPKGWSVATIQSICEQISNGSTPSRSQVEYWKSGTIPWIKTGELADGFLITSEESITELALAKTSVKLLPEHSILMAIYAAPTVGRLGVLTQPSTFNQACTGLIAKKDVGTWFLFWTLLFGRAWFNSRANGAAQQNISKKIVEGYELVLPSTKMLSKFDYLTSLLHKSVRANSEHIKTLSYLRDTLLPRLISGQLRLPEAQEQVEDALS